MQMPSGGLPEALPASGEDPAFFGEWLDSFYARDIIVSPHLKSVYRIRRNNIIYTVCTVKELMRLQSSE